MAWGLGNLFNAMKKGMTDDKGLFQGGDQEQSFGRIKDMLGVGPKNEYGDRESYDPSMDRDKSEWSHAKEFASSFNPESSEDVGELQMMMNYLGITDEEGASFEEDSILGAKTMQGLRQLQGMDDSAYRSGPNAPEEWADEGSSPNSWISRLFSKIGGGAKGSTERTRRRMFQPKGSNDYPGLKYKRR